MSQLFFFVKYYVILNILQYILLYISGIYLILREISLI